MAMMGQQNILLGVCVLCVFVLKNIIARLSDQHQQNK